MYCDAAGTDLFPTLFACSFLLTLVATPLASTFLSRPGIPRSVPPQHFAASPFRISISRQQISAHATHAFQVTGSSPAVQPLCTIPARYLHHQVAAYAAKLPSLMLHYYACCYCSCTAIVLLILILPWNFSFPENTMLLFLLFVLIKTGCPWRLCCNTACLAGYSLTCKPWMVPGLNSLCTSNCL